VKLLFVFFAFCVSSAIAAVDSLAFFRVDSIVCNPGDAFDDAKAYRYTDSLLYHIGNVIHLETRETVIKKLVLFDVGDSVNLYQLIESERILREQTYISDAHIARDVSPDGKNILYVNTSDNWTLTIPVSLEKPGDHYYYGIGLQDNNFLGFGQTVGVYYGHNEFRDMFSLLYNNSNFLFRHNVLNASVSKNTDGFLHSVAMYLPYLSRSKNQWAYTVEGMARKSDRTYYWSGKLPSAVVHVEYPDSLRDSLSSYNSHHRNAILKVKKFEEDSASFRIGRSFGSEDLKVYLSASYDYHTSGKNFSSARRYLFVKEGQVFALDSAVIDDWIPEWLDSRIGTSITLSRIRYDRLVNFRHAKWTEDVDKGYTIKVGLSRNFEDLGASDNDFRLDYNIYLALGSRMHHVTLRSNSHFYFNEDERRDIYESASGEYIWRSNEWFSSLLYGKVDAYKRSAYGNQLSLGGLENEEFYGFPASLYTGQARFFGTVEERFFPHFELGTVVPVFAAFLRAGETANDVHLFEPRDLTYAVGFGVRFVMTKSVTGLVNHLDVSWPLNGPLVSPVPRFAIIGLFTL